LLTALQRDYQAEEVIRYRASHLFEDIESDRTSLFCGIGSSKMTSCMAAQLRTTSKEPSYVLALIVRLRDAVE